MARHQLPNQPRNTSGPRACLAVAYRRWYVVLLPVLVLPAVLVALSNRQAPVYEATAEVVLAATTDAEPGAEGKPGAGVGAGAGVDVVSEAGIAGGDTIRQTIAEQLEMAPDDLPTVEVVARNDINALDFTATGSTPTEAAFYANTWANAYADHRIGEQQQKLRATTEALEGELDGLRDERRELRSDVTTLQARLDRSTGTTEITSLQRQIDWEERAISDDLTVLDAEITATVDALTRLGVDAAVGTTTPATISRQATAPTAPINRSPIGPALLGIAAGLLAGLVLALLVDRLDRSVRSVDDLAHLGVPVLGAIPAASRKVAKGDLATVTLTQPGTPMADAYQKLRTAVQFAMGGDGGQEGQDGRAHTAVVVTSPGRAEGRTTMAVNLALGVAGMRRRVVLADTDFRHPQIHKLFDAAPTPGLNEVHLNEMPLASVALKHRRFPSTLAALPAGHEPPEPSTYLTSCAFGRILANLDTQCDLVVVDAPPVLAGPDDQALASYTGGVVLMARAGRTKVKDLKRAIAAIEEADGHLLGIVLNGERRWTKLFRPTLRLAEPHLASEPQSVPAAESPDRKAPAATRAASDLPVSERQPRREPLPMPKRTERSPGRPVTTPERPAKTGIHQVERAAPTRLRQHDPASNPTEHQPKQPVGTTANQPDDVAPTGTSGIEHLKVTRARLMDRTLATAGRTPTAEAATEPTATPNETADDLAPAKS